MQGCRYLRTMLPGYTVYLSDCTYFTRFASQAQSFPVLAIRCGFIPPHLLLLYPYRPSIIARSRTNSTGLSVKLCPPTMLHELSQVSCWAQARLRLYSWPDFCISMSFSQYGGQALQPCIGIPSQTPDFVVAVITKLFSTSRALYTIAWGWIYIDCIRPALCRMVCT
jgi:hypothetical protein